MPLGLAVALLSPFPFVVPAMAQPPVAAATAVEGTGPLDLEGALSLTAASNFSLSAAGKELDSTEGGIMQARTIPNPEIEANMEDTRRATRSTTAQANIPIELGGKRSARIGAAERARDVAQAGLSSVRADIRSQVIESFFGVLIAQERVKLATGSADIATRAAQAAARRVAAGKISPVDETKARVEQANAELELAEATAGLLSARQRLTALWGNTRPQFSEAVGDPGALPSRPAPEALQQALDESPLVAMSRAELDRRQALVNVERSRQYPDLTLSLGAKRDNEANRNMAVIGVAIPLPLFDRNQGNLYQAIRQADKAQDEHLANRIALSRTLLQASNQLSVSRDSARLLRETVLPAAEQALNAATTGFDAGKFSYLDVLDAQRTLFQARIRYLGVLAQTHQSATTIDRILGR
ncbi:cobalt-zinc-cadmium efflux system outer membrane protein [Cupriavidus agavae]|uniref:Cobalt-zinc-cadmium efflux system outer membrane protein n=2 Tax=Cupriavidus agavae TaxID=1001822 RepID=A0A4Q7RSK6_9BURK|nr:cobalt-zinc-cadmium efflux system outer membrane protein [Cupriavidus agavae]